MLLTFVDKLWYSHHVLRWFLWPIAMVYGLIVACRRRYLQRFRQQCFPVPVIVVGNLTVGGVGKTPFVIALARAFQARGLRVGIVSRGYGSRVSHYPYEVSHDADAACVGDEPLLLAKKTNCPVVIAPKRTAAVQYLLDNYQSQIIISDDGLQHYAMGRAIEIVVIDGLRGLGNGLCLPAGPLREGAHRLQNADFIVVNGQPNAHLESILNHGLSTKAYRMELLPGKMTQLVSGQSITLAELKYPVAAVAAIGHPQRFFATLNTLGVEFNAYPFADHHRFRPEELNVSEKMLVMTEKDAVKCQSFATDNMYFLPVDANVDDKFWDTLWLHEQLQGCKNDSRAFG
jgi:tetraacyldisaccharide 4'-kinase